MTWNESTTYGKVLAASKAAAQEGRVVTLDVQPWEPPKPEAVRNLAEMARAERVERDLKRLKAAWLKASDGRLDFFRYAWGSLSPEDRAVARDIIDHAEDRSTADLRRE